MEKKLETETTPEKTTTTEGAEQKPTNENNDLLAKVEALEKEFKAEKEKNEKLTKELHDSKVANESLTLRLSSDKLTDDELFSGFNRYNRK